MSKPAEDKGLEQLREILVGGMQRDLERRVNRAESHSSIRASELQQDAKQRIDMIEAHVKAEVESLANRLKSDRGEAKEAILALEHREANLESTLARMQQELREQLLQQAKVFLDELHRVRAELLEALDRELHAFEDTLEEDPARGEDRGNESPAH